MSALKGFSIAVLVFLALFAGRLIYDRGGSIRDYPSYSGPQFDYKSRNYASEYTKVPTSPTLTNPPTGPTQKYEKIASVGLASDASTPSAFIDDRAKIFALIADQKAVVQYELSRGLPGRRTLDLGIGVPPTQFDEFVKSLDQIGRTASIEVAKNDKTNEYLQLRAKRAALEKARKEIESIGMAQASVDERLKVVAKLSEIDAQLQDLGVSLGEFDTQNELCTVKISLTEQRLPDRISWSRRVVLALEWTAWVYAGLGVGLAFTTLAAWIGTIVLRLLVRTARDLRAG